MDRNNIFFSGNNWVIKEKLDINFLNKLRSNIENYCQTTKPIKKDLTDTKVLDLSTIGKNSNQYNITKKICNKEFLKNLNEYILICESICKDYSLILEEKKFIMTAGWTVIGGKGGFHTIHDHRARDGICSILYLRCEKEMITPFGSSYFVLNSECTNSKILNNPKIATIEPEEGNIILFPSYVLHGTYPQTVTSRQTLNLDYDVVDHTNFENSIQYS